MKPATPGCDQGRGTLRPRDPQMNDAFFDSKIGQRIYWIGCWVSAEDKTV